MDMVTRATLVRDPATVHLGHMVPGHTGHDPEHQAVHRDNTPATRATGNIHHRGGMGQIQEAKEVLPRVSQAVLQDILV